MAYVSTLFLQSLNGVYINGKTKIKPSTPVTLETGMEICFGALIPQNELKYTFIQPGSGLHMLLRVGAKPPEDSSIVNAPCDTGDATQCRDTTPPLGDGRASTLPLSTGRDVYHDSNFPVEAELPGAKKPRLEGNSSKQVADGSSHVKNDASRHTSGQGQCVEEETAPSTHPLNKNGSGAPVMTEESPLVTVVSPYVELQNVPASMSGVESHTPNIAQSVVSISRSQPHTSAPVITPSTQYSTSPGSTLISPLIDELFSDGEKHMDDVISDAIFGEEPVPCPSRTTAIASSGSGSGGDGGGRHLDGTSIQIQAAKDEMQKEKQKLLSNIEALRSELASKERLLVEKSEKEKEIEETKKHNEGVIDSMQEEFTCVICQELFVVAHTLTCSHSFCEGCIEQWMKSKKDCPICRKQITAKPVHSLVLDNAIDKMVEKMNDAAREERKLLKESRTGKTKPAAESRSSVVDILTTASALGVLNPMPTAAASSGGPSGRHQSGPSGGNRSGPSGGGPNSGNQSGPSGGSRSTGHRGGQSVTGAGSADSPIVLLSDTPIRGVTQSRTNIHISISDEEEEEDDSYDSDSDGSDGSYNSGLSGHYYGGYGRCYNCGELNLNCLRNCCNL